jgi:hypothetical protein
MILDIGDALMESLFGGDGLIPIYRLQKVFFDEYGSPDKRVKKFENVTRFRVDVCELAKGADGNPLSSVCTIWATVKSESEIAVHLSGSLPLDGAVKEWIDSTGKSIVKGQTASLTLSLNPGDQAKLASLAKAMRTRAASREPYKAASHGNSALEIAQGLEHLQKVLGSAWK